MVLRRVRASSLVLLGALALSAAFTGLVYREETVQAESIFEAKARELNLRLGARLDLLVGLLRGGAGLQDALGDVPDETYRRWVERLRLSSAYPGVLGVGYAERIRRDQVAAFEAEARKTRPDFRVHPAPGTADLYVIRLLEPLDSRNRAALGFDMGSEPERRSAMEEALRTGLPAVSGEVTLVQEITPDKQPGFLVYVPVYRGGGVPETEEERMRLARGVSYAPLRAGDFFGALDAPNDVGISVRSLREGAPAQLYPPGPPDRGWRTLDLPVRAPHTTWVVRYTSLAPPDRSGAFGAALLGLVLSFALFGASRTLEATEHTRRRQQASEARIARAVTAISEGPPDPVAMAERFGRWLVAEGLAAGFEAREQQQLVARVGQAANGPALRRDLDGLELRVLPRVPERELAPVLERAAWLIERALLHERSRRALERNEQALRFADVFVGVLGHDLRNPLHTLLSGLALIERLEPSEAQRRVLDRLHSTTLRMSRLVEQILDFTRARIGGGIPVQPVPTDLSDVLEDLVGEVRTAVPGRELRLECHGETVATTDPDRFAQAISNLLGNAVQHGAAGPIGVEVDGTSPDEVLVSIRNPGSIPPELLPLVFEPFRTGSADGGRLGLGMYIARMIVEAHGGAIAVTSSPESGTLVRVVLPRVARPSPEARTEPRGRPAGLTASDGAAPHP